MPEVVERRLELQVSRKLTPMRPRAKKGVPGVYVSARARGNANACISSRRLEVAETVAKSEIVKLGPPAASRRVHEQ